MKSLCKVGHQLTRMVYEGLPADDLNREFSGPFSLSKRRGNKHYQLSCTWDSETTSQVIWKP